MCEQYEAAGNIEVRALWGIEVEDEDDEQLDFYMQMTIF
jgi:hypothetical protein